MTPRASLLLLLALATPGCITYEFEHEFWLRVDGGGTVYVTGQPALWTAFKGLGQTPGADATPASARALFERSGLRVRRVTLTQRGGRPYLFVAADFDDVNRLAGSPAFPDLAIGLTRRGDQLELAGSWKRAGPPSPDAPREGLVAVRFHLPSKVYAHRNASGGVERGNIVAWREGLAAVLDGRRVEFGASLDSRSILWSTVGLFAVAIVLALSLLAGALLWVRRRGRRA
jgi:hypothetical protein